ncbi:MAG: hypothetical protein D6799_02035 [Bacteroidetes bacterium]|nr:MAG: hypothetical protein D6799_02035 [Bacteroidota bacterium]
MLAYKMKRYFCYVTIIVLEYLFNIHVSAGRTDFSAFDSIQKNNICKAVLILNTTHCNSCDVPLLYLSN